MNRHSGFFVGVALAAGFTVPVACKTAATPKPATAVLTPSAPPPLELRPADETRSMLMVRATVLSFPRIVSDLDALAAALGLPIAAGTMVATEVAKKPGLSQMMLQPSQVARMAADIPVGIASIGRGKQGPGGLCFAVAFKDDSAAAAALQAAGSEVESRRGASERRVGGPQDATLWMARQGRSLLISDTFEDLVDGGRLALESQTVKLDQLAVVTVVPAAVARNAGITLEAAFATVGPLVAAGLTQAQKATETGKGPKKGTAKITAALQKSLPVFINSLLQPLVDVQALTFRVALDAKVGLLIRTELDPRPRSPLAARFAIQTPYSFDERLPVAGSRTAVAAWGSLRTIWALLADGVAASGEAGKRFAKATADFLAVSAMDGSCVLDFSPLPLRSVCTTSLMPGTKPKTALNAYEAVIKAIPEWQAEFAGTEVSKTKIKRRADIVEIEQKVVGVDAMQKRMFAALMGGESQKFAFQVKEGRVVYTGGATARALLDTVKATGTPTPLHPAQTATFGRTKGYDFAMHVDLAQFLMQVFEKVAAPEMQPAMAMLNAVPGIKELEMPFVFAIGSGATESFELQIPFSGLDNLAKIVRPFVGMMGAAKSSP